MNNAHEGKPTTSHLERQIDYTNFILGILDERYRIEESLLNKATNALMTFTGFHCESYEPPEILDHYLEPFTPMTVDLSATKAENGVSTINRITLYPEDGSPLTMYQQGDFTTIQQGDEISMLPAGSLELTLRQLLPYEVRDIATTNQTLEFINASSPETNYSIEYSTDGQDFQGQILFSKTETADDTIDTLEVVKYTPHASGAQIGTRMHLSESINRRRQTEDPDRTDHQLVIEAIHKSNANEELTVETVLNTNGRSVIVDTATRRHISDITDVLDILK